MAKLQKSIDKRNALIKATIELVNNNGFHATPMSKIAKMANVSPATIYLYFENKQDLVNKTYIDVKSAYTDFAFETYNESMSVETGFEIIWKGALVESDRAQQIQIIKQFITQKVDGIVLAPLDAKAPGIIRAVKEAAKA